MARRKGRSLTQKDVIQAAVTCLQEVGEEGLGVKHVAQQLGIKPPSLYNHVTGHQDIRRLVAIEGWRALFFHLQPHEKHPSPVHLASRIRDFAKQNPPLYAVMGTTPLSSVDPDYQPLYVAHHTFFSRWFQKHHNYTLEESDQASLTLRSFVHGFCLMQHFGHHAAQDDAFEQAVAKLFPALTHSAPLPHAQRHRSSQTSILDQLQAHHPSEPPPEDPPR